MSNAGIRFIGGAEKNDFFKTLRTRVDAYFKENELKRSGEWKMILKSISILLFYFIPYVLLLSIVENVWVMLGIAVLMGIGQAGVGMSVMHDANHGSYSSKGWVNKLMSYSMFFIGGNSFTWKVQHNHLHHTFTNISDHDHDLDAGGLLRLSPNDKWKRMHRFQHLYSPFIYALLTLNWVTVKDFKNLVKYNKQGLTKKLRGKPAKEMAGVIVGKLIYFTFVAVLPLSFLDITWWQYLVGFFAMHFTSGFVLSVIFQLAHIVESADHPVPNEDGNIENDWAIHQLNTTANFATHNKLIFWYAGGLNFQVEHHLFPNVSHVHYPKIAKIVEQTAAEYGIQYNKFESFGKAVVSHFRMMKHIGQAA